MARVRDQGVGISPDRLPKVFELFTQAERTLDRAEGGLGIGLALVQRLVTTLGGRVEAHSEGAGPGSEFEFRLTPGPRLGFGGAAGEPVTHARVPVPGPDCRRQPGRRRHARAGARRLGGKG